MGRSFVYAAFATLAALGTIGTAALASEPPPEIADVILSDVGVGFEMVSEAPGTAGSLTRNFEGGDRTLSITGFLVTTPPGPKALLAVLTGARSSLDSLPVPGVELGVWLVPAGGAPGDGGVNSIVVASADHLFAINMLQPRDDPFDGTAFVLDLAHRQLRAAGAGPDPAASVPERDVDDAELLPFLPRSAPAGHGFGAESLTVTGANDLDTERFYAPEVAAFLDDRAKNVARAWASDTLSVGVGVTRYPYDIFAATALGLIPETIANPGAARIAGAVTFREPDIDQVGVIFRRGDIVVIALSKYEAPATEADAVQVATEAAAIVDQLVPSGASTPYDLPDPPTRIVGLLLTAGIVTGALAGSTTIARLRARRVRRRWSTDLSPATEWPAPGVVESRVIPLDDDAAALRRRGRVVVGVQLLTINVGVVALAGDFAWPGAIVATSSLIVGLAFSRIWLRREHALLGPGRPPRAFVVPRASGAIVGVLAFAVLGFGASFFLKGVRYIVFTPTLAQLRWSDLFGVRPRTVAVIFVIGGLLAVAVGAVLYRIARSLARARVQQVLRGDPRPPALYLRSFGDDSLPLPVIASARRPLFELFSIRGADPFEESVAWELDTYGPVVAVGRPGGSLRSLGAAREHLSDETWREQVASRMDESGLIALAPGQTDGLSWELNEILRGGHLGKTLFIFPPLSPTELDDRWTHTTALLRKGGATVAALPVTSDVVHTVTIADDGALRVTTATTRDEATYRTAVDHAMDLDAAPLQRVPTPSA